ncbi:hypothetical protein U1Q18_036791 [Sarracenia purpurea var. burkii]
MPFSSEQSSTKGIHGGMIYCECCEGMCSVFGFYRVYYGRLLCIEWIGVFPGFLFLLSIRLIFVLLRFIIGLLNLLCFDLLGLDILVVSKSEVELRMGYVLRSVLDLIFVVVFSSTISGSC